jgi:hypothetical protein
MVEYGVSVTPTDNFGEASLYHYVLYDTAYEKFLYIDPLDNSIGWTDSVHTIFESDHFMVHKDKVLIDQVMSIINSSIVNVTQCSIFPVIIENNRKMAIDWKVGFAMEAENIDTNSIYAPYIPVQRNTGYIPGNYGIANSSAPGSLTFTGTVNVGSTIPASIGVGSLSSRGTGALGSISAGNSFYKAETRFDGMEYVVGAHISIDNNVDEYFDEKVRYIIYNSDTDRYMTRFNCFSNDGREPHMWEENIGDVDGYFKIKEGYNEKDLCTFWKDYFRGEDMEHFYYVPIIIDQHYTSLYADLKNSRKIITYGV